MDEIKIRVTQNLIDMSEQGDPGNCAIAMAIRLASDDIQNVRVDKGQIRFSIRSEDKRYTFASPRAEKFTANFDISKRMARPFTLTFKESDAEEIRPIRHTPALRRRRETHHSRNSTPRQLRPLDLSGIKTTT